MIITKCSVIPTLHFLPLNYRLWYKQANFQYTKDPFENALSISLSVKGSFSIDLSILHREILSLNSLKFFNCCFLDMCLVLWYRNLPASLINLK